MTTLHANSLGRAIHPSTLGVENFWRWFDESRAVDAQGRPLVLYHGTNQDISFFCATRLGQNTGSVSSREGFFFTESAAEAGEYARLSGRKQVSNAVEREANMERLLSAMDRAMRRGDHDLYERLTLELEASEQEAMSGEERGANIMPVYLRICNPLVVDFGEAADLHHMAQLLVQARASGHDGMKLLNVYDPVQERPGREVTTQWAVFQPEQVKSALGNDGRFDPSSRLICGDAHKAVFRAAKARRALPRADSCVRPRPVGS